MLNCLRDLVRHTSGLGVEVIKLTTDTDGNVKIEGMDNDKSVVIKGSFSKKIPELAGVCGLSNLEWLHGFVANIYTEKTDQVTVVRNKRKITVELTDDDDNVVTDADGNAKTEIVEEMVIEGFQFTRDKPKVTNPYRMIDNRLIPEQYNFLGADWDVVIEPTKAAIDLLSQQASVGYESSFGVKTEDDILYLTFGDTASQAKIEFATDVEGTMKKSWIWDISKVLGVLKFSDKATCTMSFLDKGALQISLNTGLAEYNYIMPAKAR